MDLVAEIQRQKSINRYLAQAVAIAMQDPPVSPMKRPQPVPPPASFESQPPVSNPLPSPAQATPAQPAAPAQKRKLLLANYQSPGDVLMMTATLRDLHKAYPGRFATGVTTSCDELFLHNPYVTKFTDEENIEKLTAEYPLIHKSNTIPYHFIHGFAQFLESHLNVRIPLTEFKGDVYITEQEKSNDILTRFKLPDHYWLVFAGGKYDFTAKWWNPAYYQEVVNHFKGRITFVQCGESHAWPPKQGNYHFHPPLQNVVNLVGQTKNVRDLMSLIYHASGVLCPITFPMHLAAAIPVKNNYPKNRPCVVIAGGREPTQWEMYPNHRFMNTNGCIDCCDNGGCWVSRCQKIGDGDEKDRQNTCVYPVEVGPGLSVPKCMNMIKPSDVIRAIEMYYEGGVLKNHKKIGKKIPMVQ